MSRITIYFLFLLIKEPSLTDGDVSYRSFDRVAVKINVDKSSTENKFLSFSLVSRKVILKTLKEKSKQTNFTFYMPGREKSSEHDMRSFHRLKTTQMFSHLLPITIHPL